MDTNIEKEIQTNLLWRWQSPSTAIHPLLGTTGYKLPSIETYEWHLLKGGTNNWALISPDAKERLADRFHFAPGANNNVFVFGPNSRCAGSRYVVGSQNLAILLGARVGRHPVNVEFHGNNCVLFFGDESTSNTTTFSLGGTGCSIIVGEDCMFSAGIHAMTSDEHAIISRQDGGHLNPPASIHFEPHVWVGFEAMILKGVRIGFGSVVGARSVVTRDVSRHSIAAGIPARITKTNIGWVRPNSPPQDAREKLLNLQFRKTGIPSED
jgi:acetyltransferase-like isoleucine patch superfamily enzyme